MFGYFNIVVATSPLPDELIETEVFKLIYEAYRSRVKKGVIIQGPKGTAKSTALLLYLWKKTKDDGETFLAVSPHTCSGITTRHVAGLPVAVHRAIK